MEFTRATQHRAYRAVVEQVCDAIMGGDLRVGDMLPPEREIAVQLGISRTSVREAIRVLADAKLVSRKPGAGGGTMIVRDVVPAGLLGKAIELSRRRVMDLLEVRRVLELTAAELAAARATDEQLRGLEEVVEQAQQLICSYPDSKDLFTTIEARFHLALAKASQNETLLRMNRVCMREVAVAIDMIPLDGEEKRELISVELSSMAAVVEALKSRHPEKARMAMAIHLSYFPPIVESYFVEE